MSDMRGMSRGESGGIKAMIEPTKPNVVPPLICTTKLSNLQKADLINEVFLCHFLSPTFSIDS